MLSPNIKLISAFVIILLLIPITLDNSFGLTESIDLFGQTNSVDLVLNDIWIEPKNPKEGESISIHGAVYNSGIIPSGDVTDVITVGYIVNGELLEINQIENILPGVENGVEISSGSLFDATSEKYTITVIINFHDTLSHLRDNQENNIVQKNFQILKEMPSLIEYDISQYYDVYTNKQKITIQGELKDIFGKNLGNKKIDFKINEDKTEIVTDTDGKFLVTTDVSFNNKPIETKISIEDNSSLPNITKTIFPIKLIEDQSALAIKTITSDKNLINNTLELVIFQDSYENLFKKISSKQMNSQIILNDNEMLIPLPANHEYIVEVYLEGKFITAFQNYFIENTVVVEEIIITESSEIRFRVVDEFGDPLGNTTVNNWIYSAVTDETGFTEWISVLPSTQEEYVANTVFSDQSRGWSEPYNIESNERKVIQITKEWIKDDE